MANNCIFTLNSFYKQKTHVINQIMVSTSYLVFLAIHYPLFSLLFFSFFFDKRVTLFWFIEFKNMIKSNTNSNRGM
jgi:hypothetical protein